MFITAMKVCFMVNGRRVEVIYGEEELLVTETVATITTDHLDQCIEPWNESWPYETAK